MIQRMTMLVTMLLVAALNMTAAGAAADAPQAAAEQVENPQFAAWNRFDVGASATLTSTIQSGQQTIVSETVNKLAEKGADRVVIDSTMTMEMAGKSHTIPSRKQPIPAKTAKADVTALPDEKVDAAGETFTCKVYKIKTASPEGKFNVEMKMWFSEKVPGGVVQLESTMPNGSMKAKLKSYSAK